MSQETIRGFQSLSYSELNSNLGRSIENAKQYLEKIKFSESDLEESKLMVKLLKSACEDLNNLLEEKEFRKSGKEKPEQSINEEEYYNMILLLIEKGSNVLHNDSAALRTACLRGTFRVIQLLIESGSDICANDNEPIKNACLSGNIEAVELLIKCGADINANSCEPLKNAVIRNHIEIVQLLLDNGARCD